MENLEEKFTLGNWYLQTEADAYTNIVRCDNTTGHTGIYLVNFHGTGITNTANACLTAAAPDLLKACQMMLSRFENVQKGMVKADFVKDVARKAILKALTIPEKKIF